MLLYENSEPEPNQLSGQRLIGEGDSVIVYERPEGMKAAVVTATGSFDNRFDHFSMKNWIGKPFGSRVVGRRGGWVFLLRPTPELWTKVLSHRTQILYVADISLVVAYLDLRPGAIVVETGTGSGSLTTALARAVAPTGHVHTFEHHAGRAEAAASEFKANGIAHVVTITHRDTEGCGFPESLDGAADGVFLDLPAPWKATAAAMKCLAPNGVFISFSPCIEQIQKTCQALQLAGGVRLRTFECLIRNHEVSTVALQTDMTAAAPPTANSRKRRLTTDGPRSDSEALRRMVAAKPAMDAKGHTGYLLTARRAVPLDDHLQI